MRKRFFLTGALVCLLGSNFILAQAAQKTNIQVSASTDNNSSTTEAASSNATSPSPEELRARLAAARELLKSEQASVGDAGKTVYLAAMEPDSSNVHILSLSKDSFLTKGAKFDVKSQLGANLRLAIVRPNGVNTAVSITDVQSGQSLLPLMVRYPIERNGAANETAFYVSAHPALISADVAAAGKDYVTTMLDQAATSLADDGVNTAPDIVQIAEHLVLVEHTDHRRFLNEDRAAIYPEILSLYALNQGDTFRYSVSSAGAGGMIQMIPRTYEGIRAHHQGVKLDTDFVNGMQNHANALKAMLLYLNDTWRYLEKNDEVQSALRTGVATKSELLAAGYNSNPMRLPNYLKNGGASWRSLIPAETQMYLSIYSSVDNNVDFSAKRATDIALTNGAVENSFSSSMVKTRSAALVSWISRQLVIESARFTNFLL